VAPEAESIFDLGIGMYNGSGKFRALGHVPLPPPPGSATGSGAEPRYGSGDEVFQKLRTLL